MREPGTNVILATDSYKLTHSPMYPKEMTYLGSHFVARVISGEMEFPETVFFGLQHKILKYFVGQRVTTEMIDEAEEFCNENHFTQNLFNRPGWEYIRDVHDGRLPIRICAVPEGTVVPRGNVLFTIESTDPNCGWLTNHLETLLVQLWYPIVVATSSRNNKKVLYEALVKTGNPDLLPFMLHDFGYRGSTSVESASIGGAAHLVNFMGSDTIAGIEMLRKYYDDSMAGHSVVAAEHSNITSWGPEGELDAYTNILEHYTEGIVSIVADSWNIKDACAMLFGNHLREEILGNPNRTVVIRPDSGDPVKMVPECLYILGAAFGYTFNDKGYRELPKQVQLIQGDGITRHSLPKIIDAIIKAGWSLNNVVFGSGGGLINAFERDDIGAAIKCNWIKKEGEDEPIEVYKQPASDLTKTSFRGPIKLIREYPVNGVVFKTVPLSYPGENVLEPVFENGELLRRDPLSKIRARATL